ncbi:hypothetical protein B1778_00810 [Dehalococcoides mccartyi]|uniref:hypothetical protein n=1 Tax=Dehalococcoides mccartyi TaxID=61435 RepID=UPI00098FC603|nr:hypothetical protein [Dehalococcoides mccartyi]AQU05313.1 hypothetical protein B1777_00955 [Dehalococcoides mccartyi]AQU06766.1 hypothetical protein B1778_00810 [Dehalococcoides mccartyi]
MISSLEVYRPGIGWLLGEPERVILSPGDVLRVSANVPYRGPAQTFTLYGSIGQRGFFGFDEILVAKAALPCPVSPDKYTSVAGVVDIEIIGSGFAGIGGISAGVNYDLYVKIEEKPEVWAGIDNVIDIAGESGGSDLTGMLGMMMPLMMLGMVMPLVSDGMEG